MREKCDEEGKKIRDLEKFQRPRQAAVPLCNPCTPRLLTKTAGAGE
jgi:hypothetical protein